MINIDSYKGMVFRIKQPKRSPFIELNRKELILCEDCKFCVCFHDNGNDIRYCTPYETPNITAEDFCSKGIKSKYSKTGSLEDEEYVLTNEPELTKIMSDSMAALSGYE